MNVRTSNQAIDKIRSLRSNDRLSRQEISARTGVSETVVNQAIKDLPLSPEEKSDRLLIGVRLDRKKRYESELSQRGPIPSFAEIARKRATSTAQKGAIAEAAAILRLKVWGMVPCIPLCPGGKSDIFVHIPNDERLVRVQVKYGRRVKGIGGPIIHLTSKVSGKNTRYTTDDFDFLVGYDIQEDLCYVFDHGDLEGRRSFKTLNIEAAERWDKLLCPAEAA